MKRKIRNKMIEITGENIRLAIGSVLFKNWLTNLDPALEIRGIEIQSVDTVVRSGQKQVLFLKVKAQIFDQFDRALPGIVFLRGNSVGLLIILETESDQYVVLIKSNNPAIGLKDYPQLPAGMMDNEEQALKVAMRELGEETGIDSTQCSMLNLTQTFYQGRWKGIYPSPGACDEAIQLFLCRQTVKSEDIAKLQGKKTGLSVEHEHLTLELVKLSDLCHLTPDVKAHSAYLMYQQLKQEGKVR